MRTNIVIDDHLMQAAMTGHLVLTTVHARDSISTIFRLLDLGVEPYLVANAVSMTIAQRLVRKLCTQCRRPFKPDAKTCALRPIFTLRDPINIGDGFKPRWFQP